MGAAVGLAGAKDIAAARARIDVLRSDFDHLDALLESCQERAEIRITALEEACKR